MPMHEMAIATEARDLILRTAKAHGASKVLSAKMLVGDMSCVEVQTLELAFEIVTKGTIAEGCRLEIERVPVLLRCVTCGQEGEFDPFSPCTKCSGFGYQVLRGREVRVESIEVE